jgi:hypothetical protein
MTTWQNGGVSRAAKGGFTLEVRTSSDSTKRSKPGGGGMVGSMRYRNNKQLTHSYDCNCVEKAMAIGVLSQRGAMTPSRLLLCCRVRRRRQCKDAGRMYVPVVVVSCLLHGQGIVGRYDAHRSFLRVRFVIFISSKVTDRGSRQTRSRADEA